MAKFIQSSVVGPEGNSPINIDLVTMVRKATSRPFPENSDIPVILFHTCGGRLIWSYPKNEHLRDQDYEKIVSNKF